MYMYKKMKDKELDNIVGGLYSPIVEKKNYGSEKEEKHENKNIDKNRENSE